MSSLFVVPDAVLVVVFIIPGRVAAALSLFPSPFADCFRIVHGNDKQQQFGSVQCSRC